MCLETLPLQKSIALNSRPLLTEAPLKPEPCCSALQGVKDNVVDISAGHALHAAALNPVTPLWAEECDHQNVEMDPMYVTRLKEFMRQIFK